jgi:hypothetical protein
MDISDLLREENCFDKRAIGAREPSELASLSHVRELMREASRT